MNIFRKLFNFFQAKANTMIDNQYELEDAIEEQLNRLKEELSYTTEHLNKVKALAIRVKNDNDEYAAKAKKSENEAVAILKKVQLNQIDIYEGDRLAREALIKKEALLAKVKATAAERDKLDYKVELLKGNVAMIQSNISDWEKELDALKAEIKLIEAEQNINKQMTHLNAQSIDDRLKFLKEKTQEFQDLKEQPDDYINLDDAVDFTLDDTVSKANEDLKKLKEELGIKNSN
ncbi:PspA/IM30 family protein [Winogradskyella poriferorum]|uniref:PspA/IM30 family protein n=1 Tax=Winogradskyella poriferorum TaxID=307627 RepID=UPI003D64E105